MHRDIKPENLILCERGRMYYVVKVLDLDLVKQRVGTAARRDCWRKAGV